jgi:FixJ family two-component response regulator
LALISLALTFSAKCSQAATIDMRNAREAGPTGRRLRTLLLEDNRVDARLTQEGLRDCGDRIDCDIASSLREVSAQRLATVDCALIDLSLPDASGLQALDRILDIAPDIPIVVLTGFDDGATSVAALRRGAQDYMLKQHADGSAIARAIRFAIERKLQSRRDLDRQRDIAERLDAICRSMRTTARRSVEHPELAGRLADHLHELQQVIDQIRGTTSPLDIAPDDGPLVW